MKYYREVAAALFAVETVVQDMGLTFNVGLARANGVHSASKECHDAVRSAMYLCTVCSNTGYSVFLLILIVGRAGYQGHEGT